MYDFEDYDEEDYDEEDFELTAEEYDFARELDNEILRERMSVSDMTPCDSSKSGLEQRPDYEEYRRARNRELDRARYQRHKLNRRKAKLEYYYNNREDRLEYGKQYYQDNKQERIIKQREYYQKNKEAISAKRKERYKRKKLERVTEPYIIE